MRMMEGSSIWNNTYVECKCSSLALEELSLNHLETKLGWCYDQRFGNVKSGSGYFLSAKGEVKCKNSCAIYRTEKIQMSAGRPP